MNITKAVAALEAVEKQARKAREEYSSAYIYKKIDRCIVFVDALQHGGKSNFLRIYNEDLAGLDGDMIVDIFNDVFAIMEINTIDEFLLTL